MDNLNQTHIFNMFHDGSLIELSQDNKNINLAIEIPYLAELINSKFTTFFCKLTNCSIFEFEKWGEGNIIVSDIEEIERIDLSIIESRLDCELILVFCESDFGCGGTLRILFDEIYVFDEQKQQVSSEDLDHIYRKYWSGLN